jgi:hypothetical protein
MRRLASAVLRLKRMDSLPVSVDLVASHRIAAHSSHQRVDQRVALVCVFRAIPDTIPL